MKVIALNGSPRMEKGNTAMILNPFLEGMKEAGAEVELFYAGKLNIGPCNGDMSCWFKNHGVCGQKDDMQMLLPKLADADVIVWASPVYYSGITGPLKNIMDRQLPIHVFGQKGTKKQKAVLVSTCSAWELTTFDPLLLHINAVYSMPDGGSDFAAALLRPMAEGMSEMIKAGETGLVDEIFQAAKDAGRQFVKNGRVSSDTQAKISKPLMTRDAYYKAAEAMAEQIKNSAKI